VVKGTRLIEIVDALELVAKRVQVLPKHPRSSEGEPVEEAQ
jgi:hypothetical protein